jgi:predicted amidohydrolase YtcJ
MRLFYNARIYTLDGKNPTASAIVIENGKILAVGTEKSMIPQFSESGEQIDLGGRTIIPGLIDAHIHLQHYAVGLQNVECETATREECLNNVKMRASSTPPGEWVLGHGWNQTIWRGEFGTAQQLDQVSPNNPVYLTAKSLHAAWVNSTALRRAGINTHSPDPPGGKIQRLVDGTPTGILFEDAMSLVSDSIPETPAERVADAIRDAQPKLWEMGLTGVHDFDGRICFAALQQLQAENQLMLRVVKSIPLESLDYAIGLGLRTGFGDDRLRIGSIKAFADGALGPRTAAMLQPYEGEPENRGLLMLDSEALFDHGQLAVENGLSLAVHAIGDLANHEVINAFSQLREYEQQRNTSLEGWNKPRQLRHRIEHVQIIHPDDMPRLASLDVIASMQPVHATSDYPAADQYWGDRSRSSYAWQALLDRGTRMAYGSDAPVESPNPFWGLHAAVTRRRTDGSPGPEGWYPEQRISLSAALEGFTSGAAYAAGLDNQVGKLAPGYFADLLVLNEDIFACHPDDIWKIHPLGTMIAGEWVHLNSQLSEIISSGEHPPL